MNRPSKRGTKQLTINWARTAWQGHERLAPQIDLPECVCPLCASHAEIERLRTAAEKLHAFVNAKGQEHEEAARGRIDTQLKTYYEERALVCWQVLDEIEALFQGAGESEKVPRKPGCLCQLEAGDSQYGEHESRQAEGP